MSNQAQGSTLACALRLNTTCILVLDCYSRVPLVAVLWWLFCCFCSCSDECETKKSSSDT